MDKRAATGFGLRALIISMLLALVTACGGGGGGGGTPGTTVTSITVDSATTGVLPKGAKRQLRVTANLADGSNRLVTTGITWESLTPALASVNSSGEITALSATGTARIRANISAASVSGEYTVTLGAAVPASLTVTSAVGGNLPKGATRQLTATLLFTDGVTTQDVTTQAEWTSATTAQATVGNAAPNQGLVTAVSTGLTGAATSTSVITATYTPAALSGTLTVRVAAEGLVRVDIDPAAPSLGKGSTLQLKALAVQSTGGTPTDVTGSSTWQSSNTAIATVGTATGLLTAVAPGTADITVRYTPSGASAPTVKVATVTVTNATLSSIQIEAPVSALAKGGFTTQFTATGVYTDGTNSDLTNQVLWASSNTGFATISNAAGTRGQLKTVAAGTTNIKASLSGVSSADSPFTVNDATLASIAVEPATANLALGQSKQYKAIGSFTGPASTAEITGVVTWTSTAPAVATVSNAAASKGVVVSQSAGASVITASYTSGTTTTVSPNANLEVTTAAIDSIVVTPDDEAVPKGFTRQLTATATLTDGSVADVTGVVTWSSENSNVATVSNAPETRGVARGGALGDTKITATAPNGVSGNTTLDVIDATLQSISVDPATSTIPLGKTQQFTARGQFTDAFQMDVTTQVTWSSADTNVAAVSNSPVTAGLVTSKAQGGPITIKALRGGTDISDTAQLTVNAATPVRLQVFSDAEACGGPVTEDDAADETISLPRSYTAGARACAEYTDAQVRDVTELVSWSTGSSAAATVSNDAATRGIITPVSTVPTKTVVIAKLGSLEDSNPVDVTNATLTALVVTPDAASLYNNSAPLQFVATGTFTEGTTTSTLVVTRHVTWASDSDTVTISNAAGSQGRATPGRSPLVERQVEISATRGSVKGTQELTRSANAP